MSSHHIVREDQEPALLILNAHAIPFDKIQELLEWMPTVLVAKSEIETVLSWGIKVDVFIAPADEVNDWEIKLADQFPIKIISLDSDQDLLTTAFNFLMISKVKAINCLLQAKDQLTKLELHPQVDIEAFVEGKRWSWIKSGKFENGWPLILNFIFILKTKLLKLWRMEFFRLLANNHFGWARS
jgi:thiamine pyrophosphokinase